MSYSKRKCGQLMEEYEKADNQITQIRDRCDKVRLTPHKTPAEMAEAKACEQMMQNADQNLGLLKTQIARNCDHASLFFKRHEERKSRSFLAYYE